MTTAESTEKRTRKVIDRSAFASAMGTVADAGVKPSTTDTSTENPLLEYMKDSWENGKYETFRRNVEGSSTEVEEWSGKSKSMVIESDKVDDARNLVVDAAKRLGTGYRFREPANETFTGEDGSTQYSTVYFWAHQKSTRARKEGEPNAAENGAENAAEGAEEPVPA